MKTKNEDRKEATLLSFDVSKKGSVTGSGKAHVICFSDKAGKKQSELHIALYDRIRARAQHIG